MISHSLVFFLLTKTVHALSSSSFATVTVQTEAFKMLDVKSKIVNNDTFGIGGWGWVAFFYSNNIKTK